MPIPPPKTQVRVIVEVECPECGDFWTMTFEDATKLASIRTSVIKSYENHAISAHGATR